jgi:signal transduction histidine kinase
VRLPEFTRSTTFRFALAIAGAFALSIFVLFGFIYLQTASYLTSHIDHAIAEAADTIAAEPPDRWVDSVMERVRDDPRRIKPAGLFSSDGQRLAGNIESIPPELPPGGGARSAVLTRVDAQGREQQSVRAVARRLPNGDILVIGRNADEVGDLAEVVIRALALGVGPALLLAISTGVLLSLRAQHRIDAVSSAVIRIVGGNLRERLPVRGVDDPFEKLTKIVNRMLDEIEGLIHQIAGTGDDIAHDLRTPLTRVRATLERGRNNARTLDELQLAVDRAMAGIDQSLAIITALLRIAEIEHGRRLSAFGQVHLADILHEVAELYDPVAENRKIDLDVEASDDGGLVRGDRDLLFEAIANLIDNAIKFTPEGGRVDLRLLVRPGEIVIRVADTGPGIEDSERALVTRRFYRSDKSRQTKGMGLGLSLVAAIVKLHGFRFTIGGSPGCIAEIACPHA